MKADTRIDEILEITSLIHSSEMKPNSPPRVKPKIDGKDDDIDYNYARENYYNLIERNQDAVEEMLEIAKQSEHPRAFEVVGQLIKSGLDANKELMYEAFVDELLTPTDLKERLTPKAKKVINPISDIVDSYFIAKCGAEGML